MTNAPALADPVDRLVWDESPVAAVDGVAVLVIGSADLAARALRAGARVYAFCDAASDHDTLVDGITRLTPDQPLTGIDVVWLHLPRQLDELDQYCAWAVASGADQVVAGGRIKQLNHSMNDVLARHFERVNASRGRDKARVLHAAGARPRAVDRPGGAWPRWRTLDIDHAPTRVAHHGGTFASGRFDPATRLLLGQLDAVCAAAPSRVLDWGSGAGIIATALARRLPRAGIDAVDLSWAGADATRLTLHAAGLPDDTSTGLRTHWADGNAMLTTLADLDLVVSNPPFHAGNAKDSSATLAMIDLAAQHLVPGGELWLVHNSHLPYLAALRRHGRAGVVAQDRSYTVSRLVA
ncbi:class I SAM-dependent methyltransferase [Propionibacteriaceae bacterium G1746]